MKRFIIPGCILAILSGMLTGCAVFPVSTSPSTIPIRDQTIDEMAPAEGSATTVLFLGMIPFGSTRPARDAVDDALEDSKADALINVTMDRQSLYLILFNFHTTTVRGTAVDLEP